MKKRLFIPIVMAGGTTPWYEIVTPVGAWQAKNAASYAASLVNLVNPGTYDLTQAVGAVTWTAADGWAADGTNYFTTGINLTDTQAKAGSLIVATKNPGNGYIFAVGTSVPAVWGFDYVVGTVRWRWPRDNHTESYTMSGEDVLALSANLAYLNGTLKDTMASPNIMVSAELTIMTNSDADSILSSGYVYAAAYYNVLLTQPQVAAIGTAMLNP